MRRQTLSTFLLLLCGLALSGQALAQPKVAPIVGTYVLVQDDDGTTPRPDAQVTLVFLPDGTAVLSASLPGTMGVTDKGGWSLTSDGKLSLVLPDSGKAISQAKFTISGRDLTIPFRVFTDGDGSSTWKRSSTLSLRAFAKDKEVVALPTAIVTPVAPVATPVVNPVTPPTPVVTPTTPANPSGPTGPGAKKPPQVIGDNPPLVDNTVPTPVVTPTTPATPTNPTTPANPTTPVVPTNPAGPTALAYVGHYQGTAIGAEVRYRKAGTFTLTAKHTASYSFDINEKGEVKGAGQISYSLDADSAGTGEEANEVENFPTAYAPGSPLAMHKESLQGGTANKNFELKGTFDPKTNTLTLIIVGELGDLVYEYESNGQKTTKPFPAWSPFPSDVPGVLQNDAQGNTQVSADLAGHARRDKWQEYRFVWSAKKIK